MPYNFAADSFHTNKLYSTLSSSEVDFYRASYMQGGLSYGKGVCPSVRLSVRHTRDLWQNERKFRQDSYTEWKVN